MQAPGPLPIDSFRWLAGPMAVRVWRRVCNGFIGATSMRWKAGPSTWTSRAGWSGNMLRPGGLLGRM
eukprot:2089203-Alexandrium_andersonii.AAC.1